MDRLDDDDEAENTPDELNGDADAMDDRCRSGGGAGEGERWRGAEAARHGRADVRVRRVGVASTGAPTAAVTRPRHFSVS